MDAKTRRNRATLGAALSVVLVLVAGLLVPPFTRLSDESTSMVAVHLLMELFAVVIAMSVVIISWHTFDSRKSPSARILLCGFLIVACCDAIHALTYAGMPAFLAPSGTPRGIFFWLMGRSVEIITLALVAIGWKPPFPRVIWFAAGVITSTFIIWFGSYHLDTFPETFIAGRGVTAFKAGYEYLLCALNVAVAVLFWRKAQSTSESSDYLLALSSFVMSAGGVMFTDYVTPSDFQNIFGHVFKIAAYTLLYRATFVTSVREPYVAARESERRLRKSEERYRALTELSSDWYWEQDEDLRFTSTPPGALQAGIENSALVGHTRRDTPGVVWDEPALTQLDAITAAHKSFRDFEIGRVYQSDPKQYVRISGEPVFDSSGAFRGYRGVGTSVTEHKRAERLLSLEHTVARALATENEASSGLKAVMGAICETMNWSRSTYWRVDNAAGVMRFADFLDPPGSNLERYTEHSRNTVFVKGQGLVGRVWQSGEPIWSADFSNDPRVVNRSLGQETGIRGVFVFPIVSDGRVIGALAFFSREVRDPDQRMLALAQVIGSELGQFLQRKEAEEQVRTLNAELEHRVIERTKELEVANKELEAFSYSVSHDLRAPLRAIQGFSSLVLEQYADRIDDQGRGMLKRVSAAALKMGLLIDDLLKLSRISRQAMQIGPVDLSTLAWEVVGELQVEMPGRKVDWVIAPALLAQGDAGLLRVALQNLMGNAWKYSSKRADARIEFGVCERLGTPTYFVRDNGAGFDAAYADKLFGAFQRLHSAEEFAGTGIGLATVKRIVHRHGGEVAAEGKVGTGATFYFALQAA